MVDSPTTFTCDVDTCFHRAVLDAVTVPVFIHGESGIHYVNAAARAAMHMPADEVVEGRSQDLFIHDDCVQPSRERRHMALNGGTSFRSVAIKGRAADGSVHRVRADGEVIVDVRGRKALVHTLRELNGEALYGYGPCPIAPPAERADCSCLHEAAFEALPLPVAVHDAKRFLAANAQSRLTAGGDPTGKEPWAVTHEDSSEAGRARRRLALQHGQTLRGLDVKLQGLHGRVVHVHLDCVPVQRAGTMLLVLTMRAARG